MPVQVQASRNTPAIGALSQRLALDWAELEAVSGRLHALIARQALAVGDRVRELQHEIDEAQSERDGVMSRIFGSVPTLVGNA